MIDLSQWRASVGLWNCCQAASSKPVKHVSHHCHPDSKSSSTALMMTRQPAALTFFAIFLTFWRNSVPQTGLANHYRCSQIQCTGNQTTLTAMNWLRSLVLFGATIGYNFKLVYLFFSLIFLLFLSGDVELNPGPIIDDKPDISLLLKWLEPLVKWQSFGRQLPGITQSIVTKIEQSGKDNNSQKDSLFKQWLDVNPNATWKDVILALKRQKESELVQFIENQCSVGNAKEIPTSMPQKSVSFNDDTTDNPKKIMQAFSADLSCAVRPTIETVTNALYAENLISGDTRGYIITATGVSVITLSSRLIFDVEAELGGVENPDEYLNHFCQVLIIKGDKALSDIATSMKRQLGKPDKHVAVAKSISSIPEDVQRYADTMRETYKCQHIIDEDWPPIVRKKILGRVTLIEKQSSTEQTEISSHEQEFQLTGQVHEILKLPNNKEIKIENILQTAKNPLSLRVVIDGLPGIGKTTLCRYILHMWSEGKLQYDLVLYCPLRSSKIAEATRTVDLFDCETYELQKTIEWFEKKNGEGLLIIFDGWDELNRQTSLATSIIFRKKLNKSSVIITSRISASYSLLNIDFVRHVQIIGFSEYEIPKVIIHTLEKDPDLAQKLVNDYKLVEEKFCSYFKTTQSSEDSQLAVKLINDLETQSDIRSLCRVPLVCSMVISVYWREKRLPTTLTQLYEKCILQTIRRHARHDIDPFTLGSLSSLPSQLAKPLQEMCQAAYTNLVNSRVVISSHEQSLSEAANQKYLGLMTAFIDYDERKYQFLHLSIQEFLAAWWIAKHENNAEEVFKDHFDNDRFQMCLKFVAGLTHLEQKSFQQYFNEQQFDVQCKMKPLFGLEACRFSSFYQNPKVSVKHFHATYDNFSNRLILLFQLLYESQNAKLCQVFAQSIHNNSMCLRNLLLSDLSCLSYFINNSSLTWNHLDLGEFDNRKLSVFTAGLVNISLKRLEIDLCNPTDEIICKLIRPSLLCHVQECYCTLDRGQYVPPTALSEFLKSPQIKILHLKIFYYAMPKKFDARSTYYADKCSELEKHIEAILTLQEMKIEYKGFNDEVVLLSSIVKGVTRNRTITSLSLCFDDTHLPGGLLEQLLKENNTLQALSLYMKDKFVPSLNIIEVNTPLTALEIGWSYNKLVKLLLPHIKGLHCLVLCHQLYPSHLLFLSHPSLQTLTITLDTAESAIELFTILQTNTTLKALKIEIKKEGVFKSSLGNSLQAMLALNQVLKYLEIGNCKNNVFVPNSIMPFLITGLKDNASLQQLTLPISLPINEEIKTFIDVISQKINLIEVHITFILDGQIKENKDKMIAHMFYEQVLPPITDMLCLHSTMKLLGIQCIINHPASNKPKLDLVKNFFNTIYNHPSLEYVKIGTGCEIVPLNLRYVQKRALKKHKEEQVHRSLPIVEMTNI